MKKLLSTLLCKKFLSLGTFTIKRYKILPLGFVMIVSLPPEINFITTEEMFMKIVIRKCYQHFSRHYSLQFLGFWTLSIIRCLKEHDVSETGSVSILG
jgi:hypothetical protein